MRDMDELVNSLKEFPAMPNVIKRALDVIKDPESSTKDLAEIISYDQALSTNVLKLVNSAYYGFTQEISSISRAIALLGMIKTKNIIWTVALKPMLTTHGDKELWKHSITTAVGCEYLADARKLMNADEAFVVGFLHDIGKIILSLMDKQLYEQVKNECRGSNNILKIEQQYFGTDHCLTGSLLAKKWKLPILINNTVKYHHSPSLSSLPVPCSLVYLVDNLVKEDANYNFNKEYLKNLQMQIDRPEILRNSILAKAKLLLNELST